MSNQTFTVCQSIPTRGSRDEITGSRILFVSAHEGYAAALSALRDIPMYDDNGQSFERDFYIAELNTPWKRIDVVAPCESCEMF